jgi:hypothetical protein
MKKSNYFVLAILITAGCTKKSPETLISKWNKESISHDVIERTLASAPEGQCLKDIFSVETLKSEIKEIEKNFIDSKKVSGTWKHLDLSRLPVPQANFLKSYGDGIGDLRNDSIDYSGCSDVPCIFNRVYGKENHFAGYVHYLWYLKFGNMLSADNKVPGQVSKTAGDFNGKVFPLSSYLYNEGELYAFWRLSHMLKTPHTSLSYLKEIQRVPRGERFEGDQYKSACGLAYSSGWILLNDGCLTLRQNTDEGYFYHAVTHELTHHVDFQEGRGTKLFYRSHKDDYLNLAGLFLKEFVNEKGENVRQWEHRPGIKLVTGYAGGNPQENFAESVSVFRVEGDRTKGNITTDHYNFVSKDYYQNRAFHREALSRIWLTNYNQDTGKAVFKAVVDCSKEGSSQKSSYFLGNEFSAPVRPSMLNCIGHKATEIGQILKAKASLNEPEGCVSLKSRDFSDVWDREVKSHLILAFDKYLQELQKDKDYLARIQEFYKQVSDRTIAVDAFVSCYRENNEKSCFEREVRRRATDKALTLNLPEDQTKEMADMYVSYHSYDVVRDETLKN